MRRLAIGWRLVAPRLARSARRLDDRRIGTLSLLVAGLAALAGLGEAPLAAPPPVALAEAAVPAPEPDYSDLFLGFPPRSKPWQARAQPVQPIKRRRPVLHLDRPAEPAPVPVQEAEPETWDVLPVAAAPDAAPPTTPEPQAAEPVVPGIVGPAPVLRPVFAGPVAAPAASAPAEAAEPAAVTGQPEPAPASAKPGTATVAAQVDSPGRSRASEQARAVGLGAHAVSGAKPREPGPMEPVADTDEPPPASRPQPAGAPGPVLAGAVPSGPGTAATPELPVHPEPRPRTGQAALHPFAFEPVPEFAFALGSPGGSSDGPASAGSGREHPGPPVLPGPPDLLVQTPALLDSDPATRARGLADEAGRPLGIGPDLPAPAGQGHDAGPDPFPLVLAGSEPLEVLALDTEPLSLGAGPMLATSATPVATTSLMLTPEPSTGLLLAAGLAALAAARRRGASSS